MSDQPATSASERSLPIGRRFSLAQLFILILIVSIVVAFVAYNVRERAWSQTPDKLEQEWWALDDRAAEQWIKDAFRIADRVDIYCFEYHETLLQNWDRVPVRVVTINDAAALKRLSDDFAFASARGHVLFGSPDDYYRVVIHGEKPVAFRLYSDGDIMVFGAQRPPMRYDLQPVFAIGFMRWASTIQ